MTKVMIFSPVPTHPPYRGNRQRILQIASLFKSSGYSVELTIGSNIKITEDARAFWPVIHQLKARPGWKPSHQISQFDSWYTSGLGEEMAALVSNRKVDILLLNYVFHSKILDFLPKSVISVIDTHDVFTDRHNLYFGKRFAGGFFSCSAEDERAYLSRADVTLAITGKEREHFVKINDQSQVFGIPFTSSELYQVVKIPNPPNKKKSFGIVLSANDLNLASLRSLIKAIDLTYKRRPPFSITIAGSVDKFAYRYLPHRIPFFCRPWLTYLGEVSDIDAFYQSVDAVVVPVVSGSGMAIKFAEAISRGVPTISTIAGSRGNTTTHPLHKLPNNFALAAALGDLKLTELPLLAANSRDCHHATQKATEENWSLFIEFIATLPLANKTKKEKTLRNLDASKRDFIGNFAPGGLSGRALS